MLPPPSTSVQLPPRLAGGELLQRWAACFGTPRQSVLLVDEALRSLAAVGSELGWEVYSARRLPGTTVSAEAVRHDVTWRVGRHRLLAAQCSIANSLREVLADFALLLSAPYPYKVFLHRLDQDELLPAVLAEVSRFDRHLAGDEYIVVKLDDSQGCFEAASLVIPGAGRFSPRDAVFENLGCVSWGTGVRAVMPVRRWTRRRVAAIGGAVAGACGVWALASWLMAPPPPLPQRVRLTPPGIPLGTLELLQAERTAVTMAETAGRTAGETPGRGNTPTLVLKMPPPRIVQPPPSTSAPLPVFLFPGSLPVVPVPPAPKLPSEPPVLRAEELAGLFASNEGQARNRFKNEDLRLAGIVTKVTRDTVALQSVHCKAQPGSFFSSDVIKVGMDVVVQGKVRGRSFWTKRINLESCRVVSAQAPAPGL